MSLIWPDKYPDEVLDYRLNWTKALNGDTINDVTVTVVGGGTLTLDSSSTAEPYTTVWLSGGTAGQTGKVNFLAETAGGRSIGATVNLPIIAR